VRDQDDGPPGRCPAAERREEGLGLVGGEDCGRLVEDQDVGAPRERPGDLDPLPRPDRQVRREGVGVAEVEGEGLREPPDAVAARGGALEKRGRRVEKSEIVGDGCGVDEKVVLRDEGDPFRPRLPGPSEPDLGAVAPDRPLVGRQEPCRDADQRALAGAVLAEEGVDLAGEDRQRGAVEGPRRAEALSDPEQLQGGNRQKLPLGTTSAPDSISRRVASTSSFTAAGTRAAFAGAKTKETTPEASP